MAAEPRRPSSEPFRQASPVPTFSPDRSAVAAARAQLRAANQGGDVVPRPGDYRRPAPRPGAPRVGAMTALLDRMTDDRMLFGVFWLVLAVSVMILTLDFRGMAESAPVAPGASPALQRPLLPEYVDLPRIGPVRLPGTGSPPPNDVLTDPDELRSPMTMQLVPGGTLLLRGAIDPGAAGRLAAELDARGEYVALVSLDSPGGSVQDALEMSLMIREHELPVRVEAGSLCASSCPLVLSGGIVREVSTRASVGVHQIFTSEEVLTDGMARAQEMTARIGRHLAAMGVDGGVWLHAMETPKQRLYYLSEDELIGYDLATVLIDAGDATSDDEGG